MSAFMTWVRGLNVQRQLQFSFAALVVLLIVQGVMSLLFLSRVGDEGRRAGRELAPLADAAMEIKLTATTAHLLFEEIMAGDEGEDVNEVFELLTESLWFANAIVEGGDNGDIVVYPTQSEAVRQKMAEVIRQIEDFTEVTRERYAQKAGHQGVGSEADEQFDQLYESLVAASADWLDQSRGDYKTRSAQLIGDYRYHLANGHLLVAEILGGDAGESINEALGNFRDAKTAADKLTGLGAVGTTRVLADIDRLIALAQLRYDRMANSNAAGSDSDVRFDAAFDAFIGISEEAEALIQEEIQSAVSSLDIHATRALWMSLAAMVVGTLVAIGLSMFNRRSVIDPMKGIIEQISGIAEERLPMTTAIWGTERNDELGQMARAADSFRRTVITREENERRLSEERKELELKRAQDEAERREEQARREREEAVRAAEMEKREQEQALARQREEEQEREQARIREEQARLQAEAALAESVQELAQAAGRGDLSARIPLSGADGARASMEASLNTMMETMESVLEEFSSSLNRLSVGDLSTQMQGSYQGVFDQVKSGFNQTLAKLSDLVGEISRSSETVALSSEELKSGNLDLSQRVEEQAASLEEVVSNMEQMLASVKVASDKAAEAKTLSENASRQAEQGNQILNQSLGAMDQIAASSKKISDIIGVIDEIAFQTNLLALNASVEAARAGDKGRGFAVVASEVRNLAQRSAESARQIKALIQDSVEKVNNGNLLVAQSSESMVQLLDVVNKNKTWMDEINQAALEQQHRVADTQRSLGEMDQFTQQNAALVEQASASSEALSGEAANLNTMVASFKLS